MGAESYTPCGFTPGQNVRYRSGFTPGAERIVVAVSTRQHHDGMDTYSDGVMVCLPDGRDGKVIAAEIDTTGDIDWLRADWFEAS